MCVNVAAPGFSGVNVPCSSRFRVSELVNKIETSRTRLKKRVGKLRKKLRCALTEHRRIAKANNLYAVCLTLSYSNPVEFAEKNISSFISALRMKLSRRGHSLPYVWVLERAPLVLHYHCMLWLPRGFKLDRKDLVRGWKHGHTWIAVCRKVRAWVEYLGKQDSKERLPVGARLYGVGGLDSAGKISVGRSFLPRWLKLLLPPDVLPRRCKGGWVLLDTGEAFVSPYEWTPWGARLKAPKIGAFTPPLYDLQARASRADTRRLRVCG